MPDRDQLQERIRSLSDKQACFIVKAITEDVFSKMPNAPGFDVLAEQAELLAKSAEISFDLKSAGEWYAVEMETKNSGEESRLLLECLANQPGMDKFVDAAINRYKDESLDLGIISAGVAIAMVYVAIASELDIDLGWFKLKKKGLSSEQQKEVAIKTLPQVAKAITGVNG